MNEFIINNDLYQITNILKNLDDLFLILGFLCCGVAMGFVIYALITAKVEFISLTLVSLLLCFPTVYFYQRIHQNLNTTLFNENSITPNIQTYLSKQDLYDNKTIYYLQETKDNCSNTIKVEKTIPINNGTLAKVITQDQEAPCIQETKVLSKVICYANTHKECLKLIHENYQKIIASSNSSNNIYALNKSY